MSKKSIYNILWTTNKSENTPWAKIWLKCTIDMRTMAIDCVMLRTGPSVKFQLFIDTCHLNFNILAYHEYNIFTSFSPMLIMRALCFCVCVLIFAVLDARCIKFCLVINTLFGESWHISTFRFICSQVYILMRCNKIKKIIHSSYVVLFDI
jgi:hypothetical protein